ncbi:hypothetical protein C8Q75DRAFT_862859 [Abortiporus biennis]|nr:hypothetical protein C8Q75DRAFT_862859 [Abortiporus biennis]
MPIYFPDAPVPLPANPFTNNVEYADEALRETICNAYDLCLALETHVIWSFGVEVDPNVENRPTEKILQKLSPIIAARVLGHALRLAPTATSRAHLANEIKDCNGNDRLLAGLAHLYVFGLIGVFRNPKGPTPAISTSQSPRKSFEDKQLSMETILMEFKSKPGRLRDIVMKRDNYHCAFTGAVDDKSAEMGLVQWDLNDPLSDLQVAHIISQSLTSDISVPGVSGKKLQWASTAAAMIERFGDLDCKAVLGEEFLHNPLNAILATHIPHARFDELRIWFTPAKDQQGNIKPDTYNINTSITPDRSAAFGIRDQVTFTSSQFLVQGSVITIPPPHKRLLEIHAACAQIAHMSGAAEALDEFTSDTEPFLLTVDSKKMDVNPRGLEELTRALYNIQPRPLNNLVSK